VDALGNRLYQGLKPAIKGITEVVPSLFDLNFYQSGSICSVREVKSPSLAPHQILVGGWAIFIYRQGELSSPRRRFFGRIKK